MKRNEWAFDYSAADLANAAAKKRAHHEERRTWWEQKQAMVIEEVRASGLEIKGHDEKAREYAGWEAVLRSRPQTERRELHVDDWLFFFGE